MEFKEINNREMAREYLKFKNEITEKAKEYYNVRLDLAQKINDLVNNAKEQTKNKYIVSIFDLHLDKLEDKKWYYDEIDRKLSVSLQKYACCNHYDMRVKTFNDFYELYKYYFSKFEVKGNKIKYNGSVVDSWGDVQTSSVYNVLQFIQTHTGINIPEWDYQHYEGYGKFGLQTINDNLSIKIYKNGKMDIILNDK